MPESADELEAQARREAEEASRAQAHAEASSRAAKSSVKDAREAADRDFQENALGDALLGMVGAARPEAKHESDGDVIADMSRSSASMFRAEADAHTREANNLLRRARALRAAALAAGGAVLFGVAWFAFAAPRQESPPLEQIRTQAPASAAPSAAAGGTAAPPPNQAPVVGAIVATLNPPNTSYTVEARDPEGDALKFAWTRTNACGTFTGADTATAVWGHPHPPCSEEQFHPAVIAVTVSDGKGNEVRREYVLGSLGGVGPAPTVRPTAFPTTTSR